MWKKEKFTLIHRKNISSNQLFSDFFFFSKCVPFTKFLQKKRESKFQHSAHHATIFSQKFRQINGFTKELYYKMI